MALKRFSVGPQTVLVALSVYMATVANLAVWRLIFEKVPLTDGASVLFALSNFVGLFAISYLFFALTCWKKTFKPIAVFMIILVCVTNYYMFVFGTIIDRDMIRNVFQTNTAEALDLINGAAMTWFGLTGILPVALLLWVKIIHAPVRDELKRRALGLGVVILVTGLFAYLTLRDHMMFHRTNKQAIKMFNPVSILWSTGKYLRAEFSAPKIFQPLDEDAYHKPYPDDRITVFVLMVGESARAKNFSLNGYGRDTNPKLAGLDIVNFPHVASAGTATAISVPAMFSAEARQEFDVSEAPYEGNLLDLLVQSGYDVSWLENNDSCKGVCARVPFEVVTKRNDPALCKGGYCYDEILIQDLEKVLSGLTKDTFIVLHMIGSHGPAYYKHYPDAYRVFQPTCDTSEIQTCTQEEIINTYDNSILYSDSVIARTIETLAKFPQLEAGLLFVSDHGESLGEGGVYLHGLPYSMAPEEQKRVPMVVWLSETMQEFDHIDYACLKDHAAKGSFAHDNLFHSMVGLMEIKTDLYDERLDLFQPCRTKPLP